MPQWKRKNNKKKQTSKKSWKASIRLQREKQIVNAEEILNIEIVNLSIVDVLAKAAEGSDEGVFKASPGGDTVSYDDPLDDSVANIIDAVSDDDYDFDDYYEELAENSEYQLSMEGEDSTADYCDDSYSDSDYADDRRRPTNLVIRGMPIHFTEEEVMAELSHFAPIAVHRMISKETWQPMPLVLVQVPEYQEDFLFDMKIFRGLPVKVEEFHPGYNISQCKKCKQFGHVKNDCELLSSWKQEEALSGNGSSTGDLGIGTTVSDNSVGLSHLSSHSSTLGSMHELDKSLACEKAPDKAEDYYQLIWNGIPTEIDTFDILNDLISKGFSVTKVYRLKDDHHRATESIVFQVPKEQDHIFYMCCCLGFHVLTEQYEGDFSRLAERSVIDDDCKEFSMKKPIHVLIRGVHKDVSENDVLEDLKRKHFTPVSVTRLVNPTSKRKNAPLPLLLLQMHREESHIYKLKCVLGFPVEVEAFLRHAYPVPQCKQCKKFGHVKDCPIETGLPEEQTTATLNVVLKGIPLEYEEDNIVLDELKKCTFNPIAIHRMALGTEILPMYLVQVPQTEKRILFLTCFLGFDIIVEKHNPDLYPINQCDHCKNFGHHKGKCPDHLGKTDESCIKKNVQVEVEETLQSQVQSSSKRKRENSQENLTIGRSSENILTKSVDESSSLNKSDISLSTVTIDASTNTDNTDDIMMDGLKQSVEAYQSSSQIFLKHMSLFVTSYEQYDVSSTSLAKTLQCVLNLQSLCILTTPFLDGVSTVLKSMTSLMMDIPNMPGVKSNTLDEQLHLLEQLEEIKRNLEACPGKFTRDYDIHFPKLQ